MWHPYSRSHMTLGMVESLHDLIARVITDAVVGLAPLAGLGLGLVRLALVDHQQSQATHVYKTR